MYHLPINRNTDYDVTGQKEAKDSEEGTDTTQNVTRPPRNGNGPDNLQRHHQENNLQDREQKGKEDMNDYIESEFIERISEM